jgi:hypothetical protein
MVFAYRRLFSFSVLGVLVWSIACVLIVNTLEGHAATNRDECAAVIEMSEPNFWGLLAEPICTRRH